MTHVIRQEYLHVQLKGTESDALALQRSLPGLSQRWLAPAIDAVLQRSAPPVGHLCIERLEIDVGVVQLERLESDLAEAVAQTLEKWLCEHTPPGFSAAPGAGNLRHKTAEHSVTEAFIYFLQNGTLPWSFHLPGGSTFERVILDAWQEAKKADLGAERDTMLQLLASASARNRLVRQFSPLFLKTLLTRLAPEAEEMAEATFDKQLEKQRNWEAEFARVAKSSPAAQRQDRLMMEVSESRQVRHADAEEGIYIENAGMVLLHPFLPRFFMALGVADEDKLLQPERALCLLHYLTTGESIVPEYELILPKILCNVPLLTPVEAARELSGAEKEEVEALFQAVIGHWSALRNTSAAGLRATFLLRPGKLSLRKDGDWLLQVERKTCDILLEQLPWGIAMIKLPWMEKMLWVEWA